MRGLALWPLTLAAPPAWAQAAADGAGLIAPNVCLLTPETTEGPYYLDPELVRTDITEGLPGAPLQLLLQVVDRNLPADRGGAGGRLALRRRRQLLRLRPAGERPDPRHPRRDLHARHAVRRRRRGRAASAPSGPAGTAGRTPHIHYIVFLDESTLLTSQLFFPDGASEVVFRAEPYSGRAGAQETTNANDGIARRAGPRAFARVAQAGGGWRAELVVGVASGA